MTARQSVFKNAATISQPSSLHFGMLGDQNILGYGRAADYWSLGCIAYEMLNGLPPFRANRLGAKDLFRLVMNSVECCVDEL